MDNSPNLKPEIEEKTFRQNFLREQNSRKNNSGHFQIILIAVLIVAIGVMGSYIYVSSSTNEAHTLASKVAFDQELEEAQAAAFQEGYDSAIQDQRDVVITEEINVTIDTLKDLIAPAGKLISAEYFYTNAVDYSKSSYIGRIKIPFSTDLSIFRWSGVIGAGIDLTKTEYLLNEETKFIVITLSEPVIMSHTIDKNSFEYYDVKKSAFTSTDLGEFEDFHAELLKNQEDKLMQNNEFWNTVKVNTELNLRNIMTVSGQLDDYHLEFRWK